jgi:hypothetical protein
MGTRGLPAQDCLLTRLPVKINLTVALIRAFVSFTAAGQQRDYTSFRFIIPCIFISNGVLDDLVKS